MEGPLFIRTPRASDTLPLPQVVSLTDDPSPWGCDEECGTEAYNIGGFENAPRLVYSSVRSSDHRSPKIGDLLGSFLRLHHGQLGEVLTFARSWGTLGICEDHGLPITHGCNGQLLGDLCHLDMTTRAEQDETIKCNRRRRTEAVRAATGPDLPRLLDQTTAWYWEPVSVWRDYASAFRSILRAAARLGQGQLAHSRDWKAVCEVSSKYELYDGEHTCNDDYDEITSAAASSSVNVHTDDLDVETQRDLLIYITDQFLGLADLTPRLTWRPGDRAPHLSIHVDDSLFEDLPTTGWLYPALMAQLCAALSSPLGVFMCDLCGSPFTPEKRRPRADRRCYCAPCSLDASLASKREWWRRNRSPTS